MIVCLVILAGIAALLGISARVRLPRGLALRGVRRAFARAACLILEKLRKIKKEIAVTPFAVERLGDVLLVLFAGAGASLLIQAMAAGTTLLIDGYAINRPAQGEGKRSQELQVYIGEEAHTEQMEIEIDERQYTEKEKAQFLDQAMQEIEPAILGENASPDRVQKKVGLPYTLADGKVKVVWTQEPAGLLDDEGYITEDIPEEGQLLQLKATLTCEDQVRIYECGLCLFPPDYSDEELLRRALEKEVEAADRQSAQETVLRLPKEVDGQKLIWQEPHTQVTGICLALTALAAVCAWTGKKQELQKKEEQRRRQMTMDYPDLLFKMSMLLNAGLTMKNVFVKIAAEYARQKNREVRFAYEEMRRACYEMKSGVPEARAYENFGRRCGGNAYVKLGTMLSSNLQKGSQGLADILQEEAQQSMEERRQMAKKLGEEAGTKLLLPMVLMLLVVLVILMVPAMLAF